MSTTQCGQSTFAKKFEKYVKAFDHDLQEGTCASYGFTMPSGSQEIKGVPFVGSIYT